MKADPTTYLRLKFALQHFGKASFELNDLQRYRVESDAIEEMRLQKRILRAPEAARVIVEEAVLSKAVHVLQKRYKDREAFLEDLKKNDLEENEIRAMLRDELAVESILAVVGQQAKKITAAKVKTFYQENKKLFILPEQRTAHHILITVHEDGQMENRRQQALTRLQEIEHRLHRDISRFGKEAARHSECPSALDKGRLGTFARGKLYRELDEALFSLKVGEVSKIVESELGFHLLLCKKIIPAEQQSLEAVQEQVERYLQNKREKSHIRKWLHRLPV